MELLDRIREIKDDESTTKPGNKFGRLTVIGQEFSIPDNSAQRRKHRHVVCECECGRIVVKKICNLIYRHSPLSCGCLQKEKARNHQWRHGCACKNSSSLQRIYSIWKHMVGRCTNTRHHAYMNYGGRGISVCDEWRASVRNFADWAINSGYADTLTIDRIDPDGDYGPSNCQWLTRDENTSKMFADRKRQIKALKEEVAYLRRRIVELETGK